jgi:hypothetical protein
MRILVTTTRFQDTPGAHHDVLVASGFDIVRAFRNHGVDFRLAASQGRSRPTGRDRVAAGPGQIAFYRRGDDVPPAPPVSVAPPRRRARRRSGSPGRVDCALAVGCTDQAREP